MTRQDLLDKLRWLAGEAERDAARAHRLADQALLERLGDEDVTEAYCAIERWYE